MLLSLNDDCLENICKLLDLSDQIAVACSCQRLKDVLVERIWERNGQSMFLDFKTCEYFNEDLSIFKCFMRSVSQRLVHLNIEGLHICNFNALNGLTFPKMLDIHISEHDENPLTLAMDVQILADIFPNFKKLVLSSPNFTGKGLWLLHTLEELELSDCQHLELEYLPMIFSELKLRTLNLKTKMLTIGDNIRSIRKCRTIEELTISEDWSLFVRWDVNKMPNLRKIKIYASEIEELLADVTYVYSLVIETIIFNQTFKSSRRNMFCTMNMERLQRLILHNDNILDDLLRFIIRDTNLLELRLINSLNDNTEALLYFLERCPNLELLDISRNQVDIKFLEDVITALGTRRKPILIRCFEAEITTEELEQIQMPNLVQISTEKDDFILPEEPYFQCEWSENPPDSD